MTSNKPVIGFAGLGAMGSGMATNLIKQGYQVYGYDVYTPLVDRFVEAGGLPAKTPKEAGEKADYLISMVANAAQNMTFLFEGEDAAIHGVQKDKTFILCSTTPPAFLHELRSHFDQANRSDIHLLDCPVSGGTLRAADGTLSIFSSGSDSDLDAAGPILEALSANLYRMGDISAGTKTKTVHQLLAATNIISASEALGLAATVGLNTNSITEAVNGSAGASFMFSNRAPHMLSNDFHPYSALAIILKDTLIVTETARSAQFPAPLASTAESMYLRGVQAGLLKDDDAKLVHLYLPASQPDLVYRMASADVLMRSSHQVSKDTIIDLLAGIHLAASVEAMGFCKRLGLERRTMFEIVSKAAGWTAMFTEHIPEMLEGDEWSLARCPAAEVTAKKLSDAVNKCRMIGYPCPMAATALQQFHFAALENKTIRGQSREDRD